MSQDKNIKETKVEATEVKSTPEKKQTKSPKATKEVKVRVLCSNAAGKYRLPYSKGVIATIPAQQAEEMIENGDATKDIKAHQAK